MKRVVLVAPEFPPSNTAGAHRPRLFANHLARFGWTPTVLTIRRDRIEGPLDAHLEQLVEPDVEVIRTGALPVRPIRIVGDLGLRTLVPHGRELRALIRERRADGVVLFGPPWFSFALGPSVCRPAGAPYVLDYIDPWISGWTGSHPFPSKGWWYHRAAASVEPRALRSAAHVTAVSEGMLDDLRRRYPWLARDAMTAMPYGAEPSDMAAADRLGVQPPDFAAGDGFVTMSFTGALQPSGAPLLDALFGAVTLLRERRSTVGDRLRVRFYGTSNQTQGHGRYAALPAAAAAALDDAVSEIPQRIDYLQAMAVLRASDLVLVMGSTEPYYHASKLYPAILSGRPILAICHEESSICTVMRATDAGECVTFRHPSDLANRAPAIAAAIERLASRGVRSIAPTVVDRFTAHASTAALARALDLATRVVPSRVAV